MVYKRLALITTLLAVLATTCGTSQVSEKGSPPVEATTLQSPTAVTTPLVSAASTPAPAVELPLGESPKHEVDAFMSNPDYFTRVYLARKFDTQAANPQIVRYAKQFAPFTNVAPTIYLMYMWAKYPIGTYPNVQQFMTSYMEDPRALGRTAEDWLESNPCTWPIEVQERVVAVERNSPGWLRASIAQVSLELWVAESVIRSSTLKARDEYFEDREAYLNQFRCTAKGRTSAVLTPTASVAAANPVATATPIPTPALSPTPGAKILDNPREPTLAREILVSYLANKLQEEASSTNVQDIANRLAYLTGSAPLVLSMYIAKGYRFAVEDEPVFYSAFLVHPGCLVSHPGLSEDQTTAFAGEFSRRWPDVDPNTAVGLAEVEQLTDGEKQEFCREFNDWIETKAPT